MNNRIFIELLRSALWQRPCDVSLFPEKIDWNAVLTLCEDHHVMGVVGDAIMSLPQEMRPDAFQAQRIKDYVGHQIRKHYECESVTAHIFSRLQSEGIHAVLLKGPVIAAYYPERCLRSCGDIDIYVGENNYEQACKIVNRICGTEDKDDGIFEDRVHYSTFVKGTTVEVEVHRKVGETALPEDFEKFNGWAQQMLQPELCQQMQIHGVTIPIPCERFSILFVYEHLTKHLVTRGIGIRQFADWALMLHDFMESHGRDEQALRQLKSDLKQYSSYGCFRKLSGILVFQLALPLTHCPFWDKSKAKKSQGQVLDFVIKSGNFGAHLSWSDAIQNMQRGWKRQYTALSLLFSHAWMVSKLSWRWTFAYLKDMFKPLILRRLGREVTMMDR